MLSCCLLVNLYAVYFPLSGIIFWAESPRPLGLAYQCPLNLGPPIIHKDASREYWITYSGLSFIAVVRFGSTPTPFLTPLPSVSSTGSTQEEWEIQTTCKRERGGRRWAWSRIIRPQELLALCLNHTRLPECQCHFSQEISRLSHGDGLIADGKKPVLADGKKDGVSIKDQLQMIL